MSRHFDGCESELAGMMKCKTPVEATRFAFWYLARHGGFEPILANTLTTVKGRSQTLVVNLSAAA